MTIDELKLEVTRVAGLTKFPIQRLNFVMDSLSSLKNDVALLRRSNEQNYAEEDKVNSIQRCLDQAIHEVDCAIHSLEQITPGVEQWISYISG
jgi:hypothetical protein